MAAYRFMYLDRLLDAVSDLGAPPEAESVRWYPTEAQTKVTIDLPSLHDEDIAPSLDGAAWLVMNRVFPEPDDQPGAPE